MVRIIPVILGLEDAVIELTYSEKMGAWVPGSAFANDSSSSEGLRWAFKTAGGPEDGIILDLWRDVGEEWKRAARKHFEGALDAKDAITRREPWKLAIHAYELWERNLWDYTESGIRSDPDNPDRPLAIFAKNELGLRPDTLMTWVRIEGRRRQLPSEQAALALQTPIRLMKEIGSHLEKMPEDERGAVLQAAADGEPTDPLIAQVREEATIKDARSEGKRRFEVTFGFSKGTTGTLRVTAESAQEAEEKAPRFVNALSLFEGGTADLVDVRAEEVSS